MSELSEERKAHFEKAWEEAQQELEASTDGDDICQILVSLNNDATLIDFGPEKNYCGWYRKDGSAISWPDRRTIKVIEHINYILPERITLTRDRPALRYMLTEKAKHFLDSRENRVPHAGENFYTVLDKSTDRTEVYIYVGPNAPNSQEVTGIVDEGHKTEIRGPHNWKYVYADAYGLAFEEVKKLETQPI